MPSLVAEQIPVMAEQPLVEQKVEPAEFSELTERFNQKNREFMTSVPGCSE